MALGTVIGSLKVLIGGDTAGLGLAFNQVGRQSDTLASKLGSVRAVLGALGAAYIAVKTVAFVKDSLALIDSQVKLAVRIGATTAAVQALEHAADLAGVATSTLSRAAGILNTRLGEAARQGSGPTKEALDRLGLSVRELTSLDADERLALLADRMEKLGLTASQRADTLREFGIRGQEMLNLFEGGGQQIRDARAEVERFGIAVSEVDAAKVEAANDAWTRVGAVIRGVSNQLTVQLAPYIEAVAVTFTEAAASGQGFGVQIAEMIRGVIRFVGLMNNSFQTTKRELIGLALLAAKVDQILRLPSNLFDLSKPSAQVDELQRQLDELTSMPLPTDEIDKWFDDLNSKATMAALQVALNRKAMLERGPKPGDPEPNTLTEDEEKKMQDRLETLRVALLSEREAENNSYAQRMVDLGDFLKNKLVTQQEYNELVRQAELDHAQKLKNIDAEVARTAAENLEKRKQMMQSMAGEIGGIISGLFGQSKAAAIAQAVISAYEGISRTLGAYPFPWNVAMAAAHAAVAMAQISRIRAASPNSQSVTPPGSAVVPAAAAQGAGNGQVGQSQTLFVRGLSPDSLLTGETVRNFAQKLIDFQRDGGRVVLES